MKKGTGKSSEPSVRKIKFAIEYFRLHNATEAARNIGYKSPGKAGQRLKADPAVKAYLKQLDDIYNLKDMTRADAEEISEKVAGVTEILETFTRILRGEETEETVVVLKSNTTTFSEGEKVTANEEHVQKVELKTRNSDRIKAGENLMKYYNESEKRSADGDNTEGGVIILAKVKE